MTVGYLFKRLWSDMFVRYLVIIYLVLTPIFLTPIIYGYDGNGYYMYVRSVVIDHDLDLENEFEHAKTQYEYISIPHDRETGKVKNQYTLGVPLLWSPFFLVGHTFAFLSGRSMDGYGAAYTIPTMFGSSLFVLIGLIVVYSIAKTLVKKRYAFFGTLLFWLSSHLFYYGFLQPSMSHSTSFMMVSILIGWWYFKLKEDATIKSWVIFGFLASLAFLVRMQTILYLMIPAIFFVKDIIVAVRHNKKVLSLFIGPILAAFSCLVGLIPQMFLWKYYTGHLISAFSNYGLEPENSFKLVQMFYVLFSNRHGLFVWTPVFLLGFIGLLLQYKNQKKQRLFVVSLLVSAILQLVVTASWHNWWSGFAFGNRYMLSTAVVFIIGFSYFLQVVSKKRTWLLWTIGILLIAWNWNLMLQYGMRIICGDCAASPLQIVKNTFQLLPKLFDILKTFLFSRSSLL